MPVPAFSQLSNHAISTNLDPPPSPSGTQTLFVDASKIDFASSNRLLHPFESPTLTISCPLTRKHLERGVEALRGGNPVAFPTETVYGLGADATNPDGVKKIFEAKNRPSDNPLIVHVASLQQVRSLLNTGPAAPWVEGSSGRDSSMGESHPNPATSPPNEPNTIGPSLTPPLNDIPEIYLPLIKRFWPGPLTILLNLPAETPLSRNVTAEQTTFAVRIPSHPIALALIHLSGLPIAAPSANASGKPSPTTADHVFHDLKSRIPLILDGGSSDVGLESTVVSGLCNPPRILRPGGVSAEEIRECGGPWANVIVTPELHNHTLHNHMGNDDQVDDSHSGRNSSLSDYPNWDGETEVIPLVPGMKYKHYSPRARVILYEVGAKPPNGKDLARSVRWNGKVGILRTRAWETGIGQKLTKEIETDRKSNPGNMILAGMELSGDVPVIERDLGKTGKDISSGLFGALRALDDEEVEAIHVEGIASDNEGLAIMNRLRKAASVVIRKVG